MIYLHPLLKSAAVLQRDRDLKLSGWSTTDRTVVLELNQEEHSTQVSSDGSFTIDLPAQAAGGPHRLVFSTESESVVLEDVYFGDVYLAGGQSNMQLSYGESMHREEDRKHFNDPLLRAVFIPQRSTWPADEKPWVWTCDDWNVLSGSALDHFSAVAAYAGLRLRELDPSVAIGMVGCYMGATSASCWASAESMHANPSLAVYQSAFEERIKPWLDPEVYEAATKQYQADSDRWQVAAAAFRQTHTDFLESELNAAIGQVPWPPPENETSFMRPSGLYETMLKPLAGTSFKSALFYQGEADLDHSELYVTLFAVMISDWRRLFGHLPIVQVQLPSYAPEPTDDDIWGRLREAQRQVSRTIPDARHIVALDESNLQDLHPTNKRLLGLRLGEVLSGRPALDAYLKHTVRSDDGITLQLELHPAYEIHIDAGFPYQDYEIEGDRIHLRFAKTPIKLSYGARNRSLASVFCRPKDAKQAPVSAVTELYGTLEAFIVDLD